MLILALESSAVAASAALCREEELLAQTFQNSGLTHSQTLMPMAERLLDSCHVTLDDVDLLAVSVGPGSFTGLRIGVAATKGLAWAKEISCAPCSTLEAMAWNLVGFPGEICCAMDARREQIYNARFVSDGERLTRLTPDRAISLQDLCQELEEDGKRPIIVGDGALLCYTNLNDHKIPARLAPPNLRHQSAWGVARAALELYRDGKTVPGGELVPVYHRLSQAERERLEKQENSSL